MAGTSVTYDMLNQRFHDAVLDLRLLGVHESLITSLHDLAHQMGAALYAEGYRDGHADAELQHG